MGPQQGTIVGRHYRPAHYKISHALGTENRIWWCDCIKRVLTGSVREPDVLHLGEARFRHMDRDGRGDTGVSLRAVLLRQG